MGIESFGSDQSETGEPLSGEAVKQTGALHRKLDYIYIVNFSQSILQTISIQ